MQQGESAQWLAHLLIARMRVHGRREGTGVPRESLRQKQVPRRSVDGADRGASERVEGVDCDLAMTRPLSRVAPGRGLWGPSLVGSDGA